MKKTAVALLICTLSVTLFAGCDSKKYFAPTQDTPKVAQPAEEEPAKTPEQTPNPATEEGQSAPPAQQEQGQQQNTPQQVDTRPDSYTVLVNKQFSLPKEYVPSDLVSDPTIPFTFTGEAERRLMRKEMAQALGRMFAAAKQDGILLAGVSAYRSHATQEALFNGYVQKDGLEKAKTYSAVPGTSEHETGLAIDVSGADGRCQAEDCFGGTKESNWIADHAAEYGFIIRYPLGKEAITGYQYEPWHLRYVGVKVAQEITEKGITLEEYFRVVTVAK